LSSTRVNSKTLIINKILYYLLNELQNIDKVTSVKKQLQYLFLKAYVYESTNLAKLMVYSPYSNKFENPLPLLAKDYFFEKFLLLVVNLDKG